MSPITVPRQQLEQRVSFRPMLVSDSLERSRDEARPTGLGTIRMRASA
jgi:hypothetical protein